MSESSLESTERNKPIGESAPYRQNIYRPEVDHIVDQRYKLLRKIGEGGMGYVYLAEQLNISRNVVIKLLKPEFCINDEQLSRFKREAELASKLSHPNCVTIHDFGFHERAPYIVMEFLEGQALSELMFYKKEHLSIAEVSHYIGQVCDALEVAQDLGVVHRDLKPENIFVLEEPLGGLNIKVLDFGIAKLAHNHPEASSSNLTRGDMVFGTPQYMAPEQIRGKPLDHRADVYALTVILFEMLTGKVPYEQTDPTDLVGILTQHLRDPVPKLMPETLHPEAARYCGALNQIIQAGMAKKPEERLSTTQELKKRLILLVEAGLVEDDLPKRPTADTIPNSPQDSLTHNEDAQSNANNGSPSSPFEPSLTGDETLGMVFTEDPLTHEPALQKTVQATESSKGFLGIIFRIASVIILLTVLLALALTYPESPLKQDNWQAKRAQLPGQVQAQLDRFERAITPHMSKIYEALNIKTSHSFPIDQSSSIETVEQENSEDKLEHSLLGKLEHKAEDEDDSTQETQNVSATDEGDTHESSFAVEQGKTAPHYKGGGQQVDKQVEHVASKVNVDTKNIAVISFESNQDCLLSINQKTQKYQVKTGIKKRLPVRFGQYTLNCVNQEQQSCERQLNAKKRKKYLISCDF